MFPLILTLIFYTFPIYLLGLPLYYHKLKNNATSIFLSFFIVIIYTLTDTM